MKNVIVIAILSLILMTGCGCEKVENEKNNGNGTGENKNVISNEDIIGYGSLENIEVTNVDLDYDGNKTTLTTQIENIGDEKVKFTKFIATIKYINEYDEEKTLEMGVYFGESLEPGEKRSIFSTVDEDLRKSSSIDFDFIW